MCGGGGGGGGERQRLVHVLCQLGESLFDRARLPKTCSLRAPMPYRTMVYYGIHAGLSGLPSKSPSLLFTHPRSQQGGAECQYYRLIFPCTFARSLTGLTNKVSNMTQTREGPKYGKIILLRTSPPSLDKDTLGLGTPGTLWG